VRIRQIELANEPEFTKPLLGTKRSYEILTELVDCSVKSILILLPRSESNEWLSQPNILEAFRVASRRGVEIRIIMREVNEGYKNWGNNLSVRYLASPLPNTRLDIVVDDKFTFSIDSERYSKTEDEIEFGSYSNIEAKAMVTSSIFENYWIKSVGAKINK
jgi:phosphatidylserine/phosphatidylglycerophosphate/cardiolipin synthase-like enzyme